MIQKNVPLTLLKVQLKEGTGKTSQKPYRFYTASVVDEDANVFGFNLSDSLVDSPAKVEELLGMKNVRVECTVEFRPKGFDVGGTILEVEEA